MSDQQANADWTSDPEMTEVPVRGDCGHVFTVPIARMKDGAEFNCPVCGQADSFDEEDLASAEEDLAQLQETEGAEGFAARLRSFIGKDRK